ncbi:MAG: flagellar biosynthetic protein FliR [Pseudomonadales bacterium]|nr:flagellar biosynthetic protein FliR [Pseudomonadales bacterium]
MVVDGAALATLLGDWFWAFTRIGAMLMTAPIFGARGQVPVRSRLALALALSAVLAPLLPPGPAIAPFSDAGLLLVAQQLAVGVAMGLILQLALAALALAGQLIAMTMGLGFAQFIDPEGEATVVVGSFYGLLGTLLFLALDGHQAMIELLFDSFHALPVGAALDGLDGVAAVAAWGARLFAGALLVALPAVVALTLVNLAFGVMARAAPQLNIFGVLFPATMLAGFAAIALSLPALPGQFGALLHESVRLAAALVGGG